MLIGVVNFKGGQGKTSIAHFLATTLPGSYGIITNDPYTPLEKWFDESRLYKVLPGDPFPRIPKDWNAVFDLGGYLDPRTASLFRTLDWILVPVIHDPQERDHLTIEVTMACLNELHHFSQNLVIVCNRFNSPATRSFFKERYDYPVFEIKNTNAFAKSRDQQCSIQALADQEMGFAKLNYQKVLDQGNALIDYLNGGNHE